MDLDSLNIEELASLRDRAIEKLAEKVAARHAELEAGRGRGLMGPNVGVCRRCGGIYLAIRLAVL